MGVGSWERFALVGKPDGLAAFLFGGSPRIKKRQDSAPSKRISDARSGGSLQVERVKTRQMRDGNFFVAPVLNFLLLVKICLGVELTLLGDRDLE